MNASVPARPKQSVELRRNPSTFPSSARLLRHSDFERVYKLGRRHFSASLTMFYLSRGVAEPGSSASATPRPRFRVGFTVGRALGGAVERNRMKRRLREAVRLSWPERAPDADVVINPKKAVLKVEFDLLLNEVRRAFVVIEQKVGNATDLGSKAEKKAPDARR